MNTQDLQGKLVAVLGYGLEGKATTAYLIKHGIKPTLVDQKPWEDWDKVEQEEIKKLETTVIFGPDSFKELGAFDILFRSPGIKLTAVNSKSKALITSQTKWFFENCPCKIIGITGTKGKGTTSALAYEMLKEQSAVSNKPAATYLTGNIGKVQPFEILDNLKPEDWVVYELSSFQLQDLTQSPHIGVVLMTTSEHLDYHKDNAEYVDAKSSITKYQAAKDFAVINADFENSVNIGNPGEGKKLYFSRKKTAGVDGFVNEDSIVIGNLIIPLASLQLKGEHNLENVSAAALAAISAGVSNDAILKAAKEFKGLEHRLEFVCEKQGVKFYNDSFSTTPETAIAAINSFTEPLIMILGGSKKNSDFTELAETISKTNNIKAIILVGDEGKTLGELISGKFKGKALSGASSMPEIFEQVKSVSEPGDVVLLSPACASFGMFKNYKDRGEQFKQFATKF